MSVVGAALKKKKNQCTWRSLVGTSRRNRTTASSGPTTKASTKGPRPRGTSKREEAARSWSSLTYISRRKRSTPPEARVECARRSSNWTCLWFFFFQAEDGIRDIGVTGVQTCALPISGRRVCLEDDVPHVRRY